MCKWIKHSMLFVSLWEKPSRDTKMLSVLLPYMPSVLLGKHAVNMDLEEFLSAHIMVCFPESFLIKAECSLLQNVLFLMP